MNPVGYWAGAYRLRELRVRGQYLAQVPQPARPKRRLSGRQSSTLTTAARRRDPLFLSPAGEQGSFGCHAGILNAAPWTLQLFGSKGVTSRDALMLITAFAVVIVPST